MLLSALFTLCNHLFALLAVGRPLRLLGLLLVALGMLGDLLGELLGLLCCLLLELLGSIGKLVILVPFPVELLIRGHVLVPVLLPEGIVRVNLGLRGVVLPARNGMEEDGLLGQRDARLAKHDLVEDRGATASLGSTCSAGSLHLLLFPQKNGSLYRRKVKKKSD